MSQQRMPITTPQGVIDELAYRCYRANRIYSPDIAPERWAKILTNVPAMEARFQRERILGSLVPPNVSYAYERDRDAGTGQSDAETPNDAPEPAKNWGIIS